MTNLTTEKNQNITNLLNGTVNAIKSVVPLNLELHKAKLSEQVLTLNYGVFIGITGDLKGKMILTGDPEVFGGIGQTMFGMPLEGEMLLSFSGELGNMIAGRLSTNITEQGVNTDITSPTIFQGNTTLTGYKKALHVPVSFESVGPMSIYFLLD
ncbi:chemotaxis protein CheX [Salipaludibacillus sp. CF4.18]|uniref:chemotaxis protein CheX n=1 Tax=Salipaludibacillus sp. CF4.18 TaxID=3373081 RepID=UPI003EE7E37D